MLYILNIIFIFLFFLLNMNFINIVHIQYIIKVKINY